MTAEAVRTEGLCRDYGAGAGVFDVALRVPEGSVYGLAGLNGAGKTTLLMMLAGVRRHDAGSITWGGARTRVALCPDVPEFEPWLTAAEVVDLAGGLVGAPRSAERIAGLLDRVGLADVADRRTRGFSRGMKQRLGVAAALAGRPTVLILDEPASGLDPGGRAGVLRLIESLRGDTTVIFSSHLLGDMQRACDRVGILRNGRLIYQGGVRALLHEHAQPRWDVRVRGSAAALAAELAACPWVVEAQPVDADLVVLHAATVEAGEHRLPGVLAAGGHGLVHLAQRDADLDDAFASLTAEDTQ